MSLRGYSYRLVKANKAADSKHIGVKLGRYCISKDISVMDIAEKFGVSRMTVYSWFMGTSLPHKTTATEIEKLIAK
jgi:transcriptional regulator with XRE-family HTH domain